MDDERAKIKRRQNLREGQVNSLKAKFLGTSATERQEFARIRSLKFEHLRDELQNGKISALNTLRAFQLQSLEAHAITNCICVFIEEADTWAKNLDEEYKIVGKTKPALFGMPCSIKDQIKVKGQDSTMGFSCLLEKPPPQDAPLVTLLKTAGAIPFCITNIPQSLMAYTCANPIYGTTSHPINAQRTPGGSSGGDGALVALNGAPFGIGTDALGSIRMPAAFCGVAGIKPTTHRTSIFGLAVPQEGMQLGASALSWGPLAREVATIEAVMEVVCREAYNYDPRSPPLPLKWAAGGDKPLTIGYYENDGYCPPTPAMLRGVRIAKERLLNAGHTFVPWQPTDVGRLFCASLIALQIDEGTEELGLVRCSVREPLLEPTYQQKEKPNHDPAVFRAQPFLSLREAMKTIYYARQRVADEWRQLGFDCVLCPAFPTAAPKHDFPPKAFICMAATGLYNALDFPAGVVPVTRVTMEDVEGCKDYPQTDDYSRVIREEAGSADTVGLPVAVQCVGLPLREDLCIRLMGELERLVKYE